MITPLSDFFDHVFLAFNLLDFEMLFRVTKERVLNCCQDVLSCVIIRRESYRNRHIIGTNWRWSTVAEFLEIFLKNVTKMVYI